MLSAPSDAMLTPHGGHATTLAVGRAGMRYPVAMQANQVRYNRLETPQPLAGNGAIKVPLGKASSDIVIHKVSGLHLAD